MGHSSMAGFTDPLYSRIAELIYREAGIVLGPEKVGMMDSRLMRRVRANACVDLADYVRKLDSGALEGEKDYLISALTTNFTSFFREKHHFDFLEAEVFKAPEISGRAVRIWSAGCSTGQEPYSVAISAHSARRHVEITATDIDTEVLLAAESGYYRESEVTALPKEILSAGFEQATDGWAVKSAIKAMVHFKKLNLHSGWRFEKRFDVIFCRNVTIYFDLQSQLRIWEKFCHQLNPGGWLLIGHAERIPDHMRDRLRPVQHTIYQYLPA